MSTYGFKNRKIFDTTRDNIILKKIGRALSTEERKSFDL